MRTIKSARSIGARVFLVQLVLALLLACSSRHESSVTTPDASSGAPLERDDGAREVTAVVQKTLAPLSAIADRFAPNADGFQSHKDGVVSSGWRGAWTERAFHVGARLPRSANESFEAGVGVSELYRLGLQHLGAHASTLAIDEGRGVYRDAYPSTDIVFSSAQDRLEWAYTLRDENAPSEFQLRIKLPKNLRAVRPANGGFELVDAEDNALLRIPRAIAVDAAGVTRDAPLHWDGQVLAVRLDRTGMKFPIVIDPAVETFVWQPRALPPSSRFWHVSTFDSVRNRVIVFGGHDGSSTFLGDTWEWDGTVWTLRATSGPPARSQSGLVFDAARGVAVLFGGRTSSGMLNDTWEWNGSGWTQKCTTAPCSSSVPAVRYSFAMAYDAARGNAVVYGGTGFSDYSDTWTWNGTAWTPVTAPGPGVRVGASATFDATGSRVLLFGGQAAYASATFYNDLWSFNGTAWTSVTTSGGPPPARANATLSFQTAIGRALLFGGRYGSPTSTYYGDTWEFTSATNTWSSVTPSISPKGDATSAYDSVRQAVVVFGGSYVGTYNETYEFKGGAWSVAAGQIPARSAAAAVYDSYRNRTVLFGGNINNAGVRETWEWTGYAWTQVCTTNPCLASMPQGRHGAGAAYDSSRRRFVLFGGNKGSYANDIWEFDGDTWAQKCTATPCSTSPMPAGRAYPSMAYDSVRNKTILFGGSPSTDDTWEWNGSTWTQLCTALPCTSKPSARYGAGMSFDSDRGKIVLFGGYTGSGSALTDTWEWDGSNWTLVATSGPPGRFQFLMTYDQIRKKTVLFGGRTAPAFGSLADTWEWNGTSWTQTASSGPPARFLNTLSYDAARRRTVLFGGSSSANFGDTWEYYTRGSSCALGSTCATGFCVDGACCEQVSCGTCQACDVAGSPGTCSSVINADDSDSCPSGSKTCDAVGACKSKQGQACTANSQCASGFCADGFCCNAACDGGCDVCNATPGTCTVLAKGASGAGCGSYFCDGAAGKCPTSCAADADCTSGFFCAAGGICQARRLQGGSCNVGSGGDCLVAGCRECSGTLSCKDGYCCNGACTGNCQTCAATPGTCTTVSTADDLDTCTGSNTCSSSGSCLAKNGQSCTSAAQCASGNCVDGVCCNTSCAGGCDVCNATAGTCSVVAQGTAGVGCGAYVCNGSAPSCPSTCGNDADCASGYYCGAAGTCVARKAQGATCNQAAGADCKSSGCRVCSTGNCIDGYCCDSACGGSCDACNGAALGWSGAANGACAIAPVSYAGSPACAAYACNGTSATCGTTCTSDVQCATGHYCNAAGSCVPQKTQGTTCNLASDCKVAGTCRACASGNCVDGYCCNVACGGQCQACDVSGALGTCVTVTGAVHVNPAISTRVACGGTGDCAATCNGTDATACKYAGSSVACGTTSCTGGITTNVGTCNGSGACNQSTTPCGAYGCSTSSCKTSCTADADCASSAYYCVGGACTVKKTNGDTCSAANACVSGNCVDGVCCSTSSCGTGQRCNLAGSLGTCAKANGVACTTSTECGSSFCVDGVCCDTRCDAQCAACDATGRVGTCSPVSGPPRGGRSACTGTGAGTECGPVCDGSDITACHAPGGSKSCGANSCTLTGGSYIEKHTSVCDGAGACSDEPKTCGGFTCGTTACKTSCAANTDCTTGYYCKSGACVPIEGLGTACTTASTCTSGFCTDGVCCSLGSCGSGRSCSAGTGTLKGLCVSLNGTACSANAECASGACVDGVCCDSACTGSCEACNKIGSVGKCVPIVGDPATGHPACSGTSTSADCAPRCDGTDGASCKYPGTTASCGKPTCGGGTETQVSTCDGAGTCKPAAKTCSPYVCGMTACLSSCTKNEECASGNYCKTGSCVKVEALGKTCTAGAECASTFCVDSVCCGTASCADGASCAAADTTTPGACLKKKGAACTKADECATGRCVDGFCCDLACSGQCEACDIKGSEGTCTPVVGAPHGTERTACDTREATACDKAQCDGKARDKCDGFVNGGTTTCGVASCTTDKRYQKVGACDGAGKCATPDPVPCTPYACDAAAPSGCKSTCATDDDCAADYKCEAGACIQGAKCSDDRSQSIDKTGVAKDCKPYRCGSDGKCATSCATSDDCASGTACDANAKACVIYTVDDAGGDGGCGCTTPGRGRDYGYAVLALIALGALRRRVSCTDRR